MAQEFKTYSSFGGDGFGSQGGGYNASSSEFGGGGFVASQSNFPPSSASPSTTKSRGPQTLLPCTIKQLTAAEKSSDNKYKVDGKEVGQVTIVGVILSVDPQATNTTYMIDDGTGQISVRVYIDSDDDQAAKRAQWRESVYVRVIGNLREIQSAKSIVAFQLIPVVDFNEISFHNLEVIHTHLLNTRGAAAKPQMGGASFSSGVAPVAGGAALAGQALSMDGSLAGGDSGSFTSIQAQVLKVFEADSGGDAGCAIADVHAKLPHIPMGDLKSTIDFLSDEGHLYSTIDEQHFKSTNF